MSRGEDTRYDPIGSVLPPVTPPLTRVEAHKAAAKIYTRFGKAELRPVPKVDGVTLPPITYRRTRARVCWASTIPRPGNDPNKGWPRLIHDVSHSIFRRRHPSFRPHDGGHATLEREIAEYVVAQGWMIDHALMPKGKPKPLKADAHAAKLARIEAAIVRWTAKQRRAENALRKLKRQHRAAVRLISKWTERAAT